MVDVVNVASSNAKTPEEQVIHDAAMVKVAEENATKLSLKDNRTPDGDVDLTQLPVGDDGKAIRPETIPEKFWDAEKGEVNVAALLKSQKDGEEAIRTAAENKTLTPEEIAAAAAAKAAGDKTLTPEEIAAAAAAKPNQGESIAAASKEFATDGKLSDATYDTLAKAGLDKAMVDEYIAGQTAIRTNLTDAAHAPFDGKADEYSKAADWAAENLTDDEIAALDVQLTSRNPALVKQGALALQAKYAANADVEPTVTIHGDGGGTNAGSHFKSGAEMKTAMSDPKYKKDPAFRAEVEGKIDRAGKAGVNLFL